MTHQLLCDRPGRKMTKEGGSKPPPPLAGVDVRIRCGVPLFVHVDGGHVDGGQGGGDRRVLCLQYDYCNDLASKN